MKTDIEIAQEAVMEKISTVALKYGIDPEEIENYGKYKAKLSDELWERLKDKPDGKLILVTAINPTPAGEGKTTTTIGLTDSLNKIGIKAAAALREPSLGPCFGIKGGAAGGGYAQVVPMEDLNLHFTGDFHAITSANNLLSAILDNHLKQGNELNIDTKRINWKRCLDMNDRSLRNIVIGLGGKADGVVREDHFIITVASEIMAILCLSEDIEDLRRRLDRIIVAFDIKGKPVTCKDLKCTGAILALLKDALKPNIIQTLEKNLAVVHGGPFANIAHGCNSIRASRYALKLSDVCVTEAGFGADLGAEKFFDIKCQTQGLKPDCCVIVATVRALKYNGGVPKDQLSKEDTEALKKGMVNLGKHIENVRTYGVPSVVCVNRFQSDTEEELQILKEYSESLGAHFAISEVHGKGSEGGIILAETVMKVLKEEESHFSPVQKLSSSLKEKIEAVSKTVYGAKGVIYSKKAEKALKDITDLGYGNVPVCMAKTQYSLSDDPSLLGRPEGFNINVKDAYISAGAGFVVCLTGDIMTMPGLPKNPAAYSIDVSCGKITGLF